MKTQYFASRTQAREYAQKHPEYKFRDQGASAPKNERWSCVPTGNFQLAPVPAETTTLADTAQSVREQAQEAKPQGDKAFKNKKQHAITIVTQMLALNKPRKDTITRMCAEIQDDNGEPISVNCASTYYQNVKLGRWK